MVSSWLASRGAAVAEEPPAKRKRAARKKARKPGQSVAERRAKQAARTRAIDEHFRDIGEMPQIQHPRRRAVAFGSLRFFLRFYMRTTFPLRFSRDHLQIIDKIERSIDSGSKYAIAMPRGSGKTSILIGALIWAALTGRSRFGVLICVDKPAAKALLSDVKTELLTNDRLAADFPEVCYPIRRMEGMARRCEGQLYRGKRTFIRWTDEEIVLPSLVGGEWKSSGAIIRTAGLTGNVRGMRTKHPLTGDVVRPDFALVDDPQTDEVARSPKQVYSREKILGGAVLGLGGPTRSIAVFCAVTIICDNCLASKILDRDLHPEFYGQTFSLVERFADKEAEEGWQKYAELRRDAMRRDVADEDLAKLCNDYYLKHRETLSAGVIVRWPERKYEDAVDAIQHAYNLRCDLGEASFQAEYQNNPKLLEQGEDLVPKAVYILRHTHEQPRGVIPSDVEYVTAFTDVQLDALYWAVCGWSKDFTGYVLDYSCWPEQPNSYYILRDLSVTLSDLTPGFEASLNAGLSAVESMLKQPLIREDEVELKLNAWLIDAQWHESSDIVYGFAKRSKLTAYPSHGVGIKAVNAPLSSWKEKPGETRGDHWIKRRSDDRRFRGVRSIYHDGNYWKTFVFRRLNYPIGQRGGLTLFDPKLPTEHELIADHLTSEYATLVKARNRELHEWQHKPAKFDNHYLDCIVGNAVAASEAGAVIVGTTPPGRKKKKRRRGRIRFA